MSEILDYRMEFARRYAADEVMDGFGDVEAQVMEATGGRGADVVFECAGKPETVEQAVLCAAIGGRVGLVGIPEEDVVPVPIHQARRRELTLQNVRRSRFTVPSSIALVESGRMDLDVLATHFFPLDETARAMDLVADYADGVIKAVIRIRE